MLIVTEVITEAIITHNKNCDSMNNGVIERIRLPNVFVYIIWWINTTLQDENTGLHKIELSDLAQIGQIQKLAKFYFWISIM